MRIISQAHVDSHAALLALIDQAIPKIEARIEKAKAVLVEIRQIKAEYDALPWYKRLFSLAEPDLYYARLTVDIWNERLKKIQKIQARATYELTIELDDAEANLVFQDGN